MGPLVSSEGPEVAARKLLIGAGRAWPSCSGQAAVQAQVRFPPSCSSALHCLPGFGGYLVGLGVPGGHIVSWPLLPLPTLAAQSLESVSPDWLFLGAQLCTGRVERQGSGAVPREGPGLPAATLGSPLLPLVAPQQGWPFPDPSGCQGGGDEGPPSFGGWQSPCRSPSPPLLALLWVVGVVLMLWGALRQLASSPGSAFTSTCGGTAASTSSSPTCPPSYWSPCPGSPSGSARQRCLPGCL